MACGEALAEVFGEYFAEFDTPLIEAVDAPDGTTDEDAVFVQGNQGAQTGRIEAIQQKESAGTVARKIAMTSRVVSSQQQGLGLGQGIGEELLVVLWQAVMRLAHGDELHRDDVCALVQHLKESVLAIGARLAP